MSKTNKCLFQNKSTSICDIINSTVLVTEKVKISEINLDMNLIRKELCCHYYNKLIINEKHRLKSIIKKQYAYPKHNGNIKNNKKE